MLFLPLDAFKNLEALKTNLLEIDDNVEVKYPQMFGNGGGYVNGDEFIATLSNVLNNGYKNGSVLSGVDLNMCKKILYTILKMNERNLIRDLRAQLRRERQLVDNLQAANNRQQGTIDHLQAANNRLLATNEQQPLTINQLLFGQNNQANAAVPPGPPAGPANPGPPAPNAAGPPLQPQYNIPPAGPADNAPQYFAYDMNYFQYPRQ